MTNRVEIVADFVCPWCFIGKRRLERALQEAQRTLDYSIHWFPFELDPSMPRSGRERSSYRTQRFGSLERSMQMDQRATLAGQSVGIAFRYDLMTVVPNTFDAHRLVAWSGVNGDQSETVDAIFRAYFLEGRDIGARATLLEIAEDLWLPRLEVEALLDDPSSANELRELERRIRAQRVVTIPSYILNRAELVQGLDSLIADIHQSTTTGV